MNTIIRTRHQCKTRHMTHKRLLTHVRRTMRWQHVYFRPVVPDPGQTAGHNGLERLQKPIVLTKHTICCHFAIACLVRGTQPAWQSCQVCKHLVHPPPFISCRVVATRCTDHSRHHMLPPAKGLHLPHAHLHRGAVTTPPSHHACCCWQSGLPIHPCRRPTHQPSTLHHQHSLASASFALLALFAFLVLPFLAATT